MNASELETGFSLGAWAVQPHRHRLVRGKEVVHVVPKVMQVMLYLAQRPGEVVRREALLDAIWGEVVVSDEALTRAVSTLRQAVGDDFRAPTYVETVPKQGYRLVAPVRPLPPAPPVRAALAPPRAPEPSRRRRGAWMAAALVVAVLVVGFAREQLRDPSPQPPGLAQRPLTTLPGTEFDPALSPDGAHVAFAWIPDSLQRGAPELYVKSLDGESLVQLTHHPAPEYGPAWSPDGMQIAFIRYTEGACEIAAVPSKGGAERLLGACGSNRMADLAWSPDGTLLAFSDRVGPEAPFGIVLLNLENGERRPLTQPLVRQADAGYRDGDVDPAFSPDGSHVAFIRSRSDTAVDLYLAPVAGGSPRRLAALDQAAEGLAWSAEGRYLFFASDQLDGYRLWRVPVAGGPPERVAADETGMRNPSAAARGGQQRLVGEAWLVDTDVWEARLAPGDTATLRPLLASTRRDRSPQFAPDGQRVSFVSTRSGYPEVWVSDAPTTLPRRLTSLQSNLVDRPAWSPDGQRLVFEAHHGGASHLYLMQADGTGLHRLTAGPNAHVAPGWSRDGRWIYFGANRGGTWQVWQIPAEGGPAHPVTRAGGFAAVESADGAFLYYTRHREKGLWRKTLPDGPEEQIVALPTLGGRLPWALTDDGLYLLDWREDFSLHLAFYDLATGTRRPVATPTKRPLLAYTTFTLSPDGRRLLFAQFDREDSDLMLVEGPAHP